AAPPVVPADNGRVWILCDRKEQFADAAAVFRQATHVNPKDARAHRNLGNALSHLGKNEEAVAAYGAAIKLEPAHAGVHFSLGVVLTREGRTDEAIAAYREAVRLD